MKTLEHLTAIARRSFSNISHDPEGRGDRTILEYSDELDEDIEKLKSHGAGQDQIDRYKKGYEAKFVKWLGSQANTASSFITGGSNFPVRRQEKLRGWADNHYKKFREWRVKVLYAYEKYERKAEKKKAYSETERSKQANREIPFEGGKVILNYEIDRIQVMHDEKPSPEKISQFKSCGFRWSPFHKVWQRQLTNNAISSAKRLLTIEI